MEKSIIMASNMSSSKSITIGSFNCRGALNKKEYLSALSLEVDILCVQEHWLSELQMSFLGDINDRFVYTGVSGFDNSTVLHGRPYGGCGILWRSDIVSRVTVLNTYSKRLCAIRMESNDWKMLVVCVYLPYEDGYDNIDAFSDEISRLENLINNNLDCHIITCGDFNVDFSRNWLHTEVLSSFCENMNVKSVCGHPNSTIDYTYNFGMSRFNILDHFLLSGVLYENCVVRAYVLHDVDNLSDHDATFLDLDLDVRYVGLSANVYTPRLSWKKASDSDLFNYKSALSMYLGEMNFQSDVFTCHDTNCKNSYHFRTLSDYVHDITIACLKAGQDTIPVTAPRQQNGRLAGWLEHVQPLREKSLFWHHLWVENGKPHAGVVADCMRRSRAAYHYAVRFIRKDEDNIRCERIMNTAEMNDDCNFWSEIKRIRAKKPARCKTVDGFSNDDDIAQLFASSYKDLYTSVPYNESEMLKLIEANDVNVMQNGFTGDCIITASDVKKAVSKLKSHKSDGSFELNTDHFLNAGDDLLYTRCAPLFSYSGAWLLTSGVLYQHHNLYTQGL